MAEDKRIRVTADTSPLQVLRQGAETLFAGITQMERQVKQISDETIASIQKQIDLLKERNGLMAVNPNVYNNRMGNGFGANVVGGVLSPQGMPASYQLPVAGGSIFEKIYNQLLRLTDVIERNGGGGDNTKPKPDKPSPFNLKPGGSFGLPTSLQGVMNLLPGFGLIAGIGGLINQQLKFNNAQYFAENAAFERNNYLRNPILNTLSLGITGTIADREDQELRRAYENDKALSAYSSLHSMSYQQSLATQLSDQFGRDRILASINDSWAKAPNRTQLQKSFSNWGMGAEYLLDKEMEMWDKMTFGGASKAADFLGFGKDDHGLMKKVVAGFKHGISAGVAQGLDAGGMNLGSYSQRLRENEASVDDYDARRHQFDGLRTYINGVPRIRNWATDTLGLSMTEVLQKQVAMERAGVSSSNINNGNILQLLIGQKITGLDDSILSSLQAATRFGNLSGSDVLTNFYRAQRDRYGTGGDNAVVRNVTLGEQLKTFSNIASSIAARVGRVNASGISSAMGSIQRATGAEGQQLERIQSALLGGYSEDDVTQSMVSRVLRAENPNLSYFGIRAKMEAMQNDPEMAAKVLQQFYDTSGGGENFKHFAKAAFKNLGFTDVEKIAEHFERGGNASSLITGGILDKGMLTAAQAASMVTSGEADAASKRNNQTLAGYEQLDANNFGIKLKEALQSLEKPIPVTFNNNIRTYSADENVRTAPDGTKYTKGFDKDGQPISVFATEIHGYG